MGFFTFTCVFVVIWILIMGGTAGIGLLRTGGDDEWSIIAWILSSLGFAVCFVALLVQNGKL